MNNSSRMNNNNSETSKEEGNLLISITIITFCYFQINTIVLQIDRPIDITLTINLLLSKNLAIFTIIPDKKLPTKGTDSNESLSQNVSQMLMFVNVPVNLTIEKYKIDLPKNVPFIKGGKQLGNIYQFH